LECSPGGFRAESKTVLGKAQSPRVEASQGFYCSGFIQPNKQTNKHGRQQPFRSHQNKCVTIAQFISIYPLAKMNEVLQSVDELPASKHPSNPGKSAFWSWKQNKKTKLDCVSASSRGLIAVNFAEAGY